MYSDMVIVLFLVMMWRTIGVFAVPEVVSLHAAADRFQNSVQQQTFQTVLISIEERLKNLDNFYSMQLSETVKSKLDQFHRRLEMLDTKIIRMESLVMINLDKISENISTKNYRDDLSKTQMYRKLENIYDGLTHKFNYMERRFDLAVDKLQNKADSTLERLERLEDDMLQRHNDIETELSETSSSLEDQKTSLSKAESTLTGIAEALKVQQPLVQNLTHILEDLNDTIRRRLDTSNTDISKILNETNHIRTTTDVMKTELKEDFNSYATKVSDMNMDVWNRNTAIEDTVKNIELVANATRIETQNGLRAVMLQIGKISAKELGVGSSSNDNIASESLKKTLILSLEKIIANQALFLESCHRLQKDEAQIESEISDTLEKLINMIDVKLALVMKDLKGMEKSLKSHDSRINRNLNQANMNVISLFEKMTKLNDQTEKFLTVNTCITEQFFKWTENNVTERLTKGILQSANNTISVYLNIAVPKLINTTLNDSFQSFLQLIDDTQSKIQNQTATLQALGTQDIALCRKEILKDKSSNNSNLSAISSKSNPDQSCLQDYRHLIDVRTGILPCSNQTKVESKTFAESNEKVENDEEAINKTILEIFGKPPSTSSRQKSKIRRQKTRLCATSTAIKLENGGKNCTKKGLKKNKAKHNHKTRIDVRYGEDADESTPTNDSEDYQYIDEIETSTNSDSVTQSLFVPDEVKTEPSVNNNSEGEE